MGERCFTRDRLLTLPLLVLFQINLLKNSLQTELDSFFQQLYCLALPMRVITKSAFCHARKKLKHTAFITLLRALNAFYESNGPLRTWRGLQVFAGDGSSITLPPGKKITKTFGQHQSKEGRPVNKGRVSMFYNVLSGMIADLTLSSYHDSEISMFVTQIREFLFPKKSLLILDRGYALFAAFLVMEKVQPHLAYCIRLSKNTRIVKKLVKSGQDEGVFTWKPGYSTKQDLVKHGIKPKALKLRVIRIKLKTGQDEFLATNLFDSKSFPYEDFQWLYHQRWTVEEGFKRLKCPMSLENFSGKSVLAVRQDFYAKAFTHNLAMALQNEVGDDVAQRYQDRKFEYKVNITSVISTMKHAVVLLLTMKDPQEVIATLRKLWESTVEAIRPDRTSKRHSKTKGEPRGSGPYMCYKPTL
jgi:hypothetical protein